MQSVATITVEQARNLALANKALAGKYAELGMPADRLLREAERWDAYAARGGADSFLSQLSAEEEDAIRSDARRWATRARISREEWDRVSGFPFWPRWVIPAIGIGLAAVGGFCGFAVVHSLER